MPKQQKITQIYSRFQAFRRCEYDTGPALTFFVGLNKKTGLWETIHAEESENVQEAKLAMILHMQRTGERFNNYTWLGSLTDDQIRTTFQSKAQAS